MRRALRTRLVWLPGLQVHGPAAMSHLSFDPSAFCRHGSLLGLLSLLFASLVPCRAASLTGPGRCLPNSLPCNRGLRDYGCRASAKTFYGLFAARLPDAFAPISRSHETNWFPGSGGPRKSVPSGGYRNTCRLALPPAPADIPWTTLGVAIEPLVRDGAGRGVVILRAG